MNLSIRTQITLSFNVKTNQEQIQLTSILLALREKNTIAHEINVVISSYQSM